MSLKIFVVDDDDSHFNLIVKAFQMQGIETFPTNNQIILESIRKNDYRELVKEIEEVKPNGVILDLYTGKQKLFGDQVISELRKKDTTTPVVVFSGVPTNLKDYEKNRFVWTLNKPSQSEFVPTLRQQIELYIEPLIKNNQISSYLTKGDLSEALKEYSGQMNQNFLQLHLKLDANFKKLETKLDWSVAILTVNLSVKQKERLKEFFLQNFESIEGLEKAESELKSKIVEKLKSGLLGFTKTWSVDIVKETIKDVAKESLKDNFPGFCESCIKLVIRGCLLLA
jgi:CheY-like chemotaxis protein